MTKKVKNIHLFFQTVNYRNDKLLGRILCFMFVCSTWKTHSSQTETQNKKVLVISYVSFCVCVKVMEEKMTRKLISRSYHSLLITKTTIDVKNKQNSRELSWNWDKQIHKSLIKHISLYTFLLYVFNGMTTK